MERVEEARPPVGALVHAHQPPRLQLEAAQLALPIGEASQGVAAAGRAPADVTARGVAARDVSVPGVSAHDATARDSALQWAWAAP